MLDREQRLTSSADFVRAFRGRRAGTRSLVLALDASRTSGVASDLDASPGAARVGFTVGRAVGGAVARNRVRRRLRHLMRDRVRLIPAGAVLVVRANAPAAAASYDGLGADLDRALHKLLGERVAR